MAITKIETNQILTKYSIDNGLQYLKQEAPINHKLKKKKCIANAIGPSEEGFFYNPKLA